MQVVKNYILLIILMLLNIATTFSTDKIRCSTADVFRRNAINHPDAILRKQEFENEIQQWLLQNNVNRENGIQSIVTIPVVIHVVYKNSTENISEEQILSQLDRLNKDFRNINTDKLLSSHPFFPLAGDAGIEFCLAKIDPNGNSTTGITRTSTTVSEFSDDDQVKFISGGGTNAWNASEYLNIWVCDLGNQLLGYATLPSEFSGNPEKDGVVINFTAFGSTGTANPPYDFGRTATHEVGHWLNLEHIWGDDFNCGGSDNVSDTPNQEVETTDCPSGVQTDNCTASAPGIMYQNYMDYTEDACMVMFTNGQIARMTAVLNIERTGIVASNKCSGTTGIGTQAKSQFKIYPNPIQNYLMIEGLPKTRIKYFTIEMFNAIGQKVYSKMITTEDQLIEMADFKTGTYMMMIYNEEFSTTQKLTVVK